MKMSACFFENSPPPPSYCPFTLPGEPGTNIQADLIINPNYFPSRIPYILLLRTVPFYPKLNGEAHTPP